MKFPVAKSPIARQIGIGLLVLSIIFFFVAWTGNSPVALLLGDSMKPTAGYLSLAFIENVPIEEVEVGDIVAFWVPHQFQTIAHRVVEVEYLTIGHDEDNNPIQELVITTQGDNRERQDRVAVKKDNYKGVVVDFVVLLP